MEIFEAIRQRRAVRDYKPEPVAARLVRELIHAASWAPSAMNEQPWHFTVVTDRGLLDTISTRSKAAMLDDLDAVPRAAHFRDVLADPAFHIFYHAPVLVVISAPSEGRWCVADCALAGQNLMLAAHARGLGSCWIGFAETWLNTKAGRDALGLADRDQIVAPIIVGHPTVAPPAVPRKPLSVNWIGESKLSSEESS